MKHMKLGISRGIESSMEELQIFSGKEKERTQACDITAMVLLLFQRQLFTEVVSSGELLSLPVFYKRKSKVFLDYVNEMT